MRALSIPTRLSNRQVAWGVVLSALLVLPFADLSIDTPAPFAELKRILLGFAPPAFGEIDLLLWATLQTTAFALIGVSIGAVIGFLLAPFYRLRLVRGFAISVRSVHEIFWALLLLQITGLSLQTGIIAIALPYAGIFAKVFSDYLEEVDPVPATTLAPLTRTVSRFLFAELPQAWPQLRSYLFYRYECGLRSSAVLGFIGLPTLGFQLDSFFRQGNYSAAAALLLVYYCLVASIPLWLRWKLLPILLAASAGILLMIEMPPNVGGSLYRFLTEDIIPHPLRNADLSFVGLAIEFWQWLKNIFGHQALPGLFATLVVAQLALLLTSVVAVSTFPIAIPAFVGKLGAVFGHVWLVILRTSPEYMLVYIFVLVLGPSMLPAVLALGLHNGAIIAHLLAREGSKLANELRPDAPRGINLYAYEVLPRLSPSAINLVLYRWEIIVRESSIVGVIGIMTLGFYIDSALGELKLDVVMVLLLTTMLVTAAIDMLSDYLRRGLSPKGLRTFPERMFS